MNATKSKKVPVSAAKEFADKYEKDQVILISWENETQTTWVTTYGKTAEDCDQAAQGGNWLKKELFNWPESHCVAEPHRLKKLKKENKELRTQLKELSAQKEVECSE